MKYIGIAIFTLMWSACIYDALKHSEYIGVYVMGPLTAAIVAIILINRKTK